MHLQGLQALEALVRLIRRGCIIRSAMSTREGTMTCHFNLPYLEHPLSHNVVCVSQFEETAGRVKDKVQREWGSLD